MLMTKQRRPAIQTLRDWAISVLQDAGAIRECETHGWMQDRADPHARAHAFDIARRDSPPGISRQAAVDAIAEVLEGIGDTCPECPPDH
jgi:hypothetical protein